MQKLTLICVFNSLVNELAILSKCCHSSSISPLSTTVVYGYDTFCISTARCTVHYCKLTNLEIMLPC